MKPLLLIFIIAIVFSKNAISQAHSSAAEQTTYYEYDDLGNTTSLTNDAGSVVEKYKYDVFGKPAITDANNNTLAASAFGNRYMFTGREFMEQLNMYDYRNRIYSPQEGRFIHADPIGFWAGDYNLYRYVYNSPVNYVDPKGLMPPGVGPPPGSARYVARQNGRANKARAEANAAKAAVGDPNLNPDDQARADELEKKAKEEERKAEEANKACPE